MIEKPAEVKKGGSPYAPSLSGARSYESAQKRTLEDARVRGGPRPVPCAEDMSAVNIETRRRSYLNPLELSKEVEAMRRGNVKPEVLARAEKALEERTVEYQKKYSQNIPAV